MKHLDLFSGIGGFALAARWAGIETVGFCEVDPFCQSVLSKNFPSIPINNDVKTLDGAGYYAVDIITGGYPCQPFSLAGNRHGTADQRHLWPYMRNIIRAARPSWIICENVAGHITIGLDQVITDLEDEGYSSATFVIPASAVGAPHKRERVWIVANAKRDGRNEAAKQGSAGSRIDERRMQQPEGLSDPSNSVWSNQYSDTAGWQLPTPIVAGVDDGIPNRMDRIKSLGNAIVPQVAYQLFSTIKSVGERLTIEKIV